MPFYSHSYYPILDHCHLLGKQKKPTSKQSSLPILCLLHSNLYALLIVIFQKHNSIHVTAPLPSPQNNSIDSSNLGPEDRSLT